MLRKDAIVIFLPIATAFARVASHNRIVRQAIIVRMVLVSKPNVKIAQIVRTVGVVLLIMNAFRPSSKFIANQVMIVKCILRKQIVRKKTILVWVPEFVVQTFVVRTMIVTSDIIAYLGKDCQYSFH